MLAACAVLALASVAVAQERAAGVGDAHAAGVFGVEIGMDVPTALQSVFVNAQRKPGQERPDAKKNEGKENKDVRVLYKLSEGNLQIVFAEGRWVKEIFFEYAKPLATDDLKLLDSTATFANTGGETRRDDRYAVGFTGDDKKEKFWWRDERTVSGYRVRVGFVSGKLTKGGLASKEVTRKIVTVMPEDADKFAQAMAAKPSA
ncbi:MAG TPA: hypothetical protein VF754_04565 [Pyrinomonadaceae bacterium]